MLLYLLSTSVEPGSSASFTATVVIAGIGTVLATLALLILVFNLFGKFVTALQNRVSEKKKQQLSDEISRDNRQYKPISEMSADELPPELEDGQPGGEVVAAISAAVYMMCGEGAVIKSIRKKKSAASDTASLWAQAAVFENTRPF